MEELIKRLERVIQTGAPDKDRLHPIAAEVVLEVVKELTEHGTNLVELGTDRAVKGFPIDADDLMLRVEEKYGFRSRDRLYDIIRKMPKYELASIQPDNGLQKLADEIASFKRHVKSENSDYLTGYLCALSAVEGMIADMREVTT